MAFFARKPAPGADDQTGNKTNHGKHQDRQDLLEFHRTGDCSRDRLHRSQKPLERSQDQKHRDIDRQNDDNSTDQRRFHEFGNRSHLGLAPNGQPASTPLRRFVAKVPSSLRTPSASRTVAGNP